MGLAEDTRFILFAGRLHPQKDPLLLIRAMAALRHPQAHLLVVGKGELEPEIRAEIKRQGLVGQVSLLGAVQQSTLADLYRLADLFVLTSAYEGLARGSLEALACGTPVVTTRSGETPSFLAADSGIVCEVREPGAIATAWAEVLQHPQGYPSSACVRVATPYEARQVIQSLYGALLRDWQAQKMASQLLLGTGNDWASGQSSQASQAGDGTINGASTGASAWVRDRE
jgi:glycosyltransferase involved in cell wall biosynthesis